MLFQPFDAAALQDLPAGPVGRQVPQPGHRFVVFINQHGPRCRQFVASDRRQAGKRFNIEPVRRQPAGNPLRDAGLTFTAGITQALVFHGRIIARCGAAVKLYEI